MASALVAGHAQAALGGGGGGGGTGRTSPTLSVSEVVGPTFESEARDQLRGFIRALCPWARDHSSLVTRGPHHGGATLQADITCLVEGDTLAPCAALPAEGASVVELRAPTAPALPAMPLPPGREFSPPDAARLGPHKYFIAVAYSGQREDEWGARAQQLEAQIELATRRWEDWHQGVEGLPRVTDVTQLVGAAALIFSCGEGSCQQQLLQLQRAEELVARAAARLPRLRRLAAAGRLVVIVLERSQTPNTHFQRAMAAQSERLAGQIAALTGLAAGLAAKM